MKDRLTFILLTASFIIDNAWQLIGYNYERFIHFNGNEGYYYDYHLWYTSNEIRILMFIFAGFFCNNLAINRASIVSFSLVHVVSYFQYLYSGVSNEHYYIFELAYLAICYILYQQWK